MLIRYIRDWLNGSTANTSNHWIEIKAIDVNGTNIALGKTVTFNNTLTYVARVTDGDLTVANYADGGAGLRWVCVDLGAIVDIKSVVVWHYYGDSRTYHKTKMEVSTDNTNWITEFDSAVVGEYAESSSGRTTLILPKAQAPSVSSDDSNSKIIGIDSTMEYNIDGAGWVKYTSDPTLSGWSTVLVRVSATPNNLASDPVQLIFTDRASRLVDEIQIDFGGSVGAPYGRDQYTRMGHIEILGYEDSIDYGLNTNGATWTANTSYTGYQSSNIGLPAGTSMHHNNATGAKWYNCKFAKPFYPKCLTAMSGNYNDTYYVDFPQHIRITMKYLGTVVKIIETTFTQPTALSQRNTTPILLPECPNISIQGIPDKLLVLTDYPVVPRRGPSTGPQEYDLTISKPSVTCLDNKLNASVADTLTITISAREDPSLFNTYTLTAVNTLYKIYTCDYIDESKLASLTKVEVIT